MRVIFCCGQVIQKKFSEFQLGLEAGTERFTHVDNMATELIEKQSPYSSDIYERQQMLQ